MNSEFFSSAALTPRRSRIINRQGAKSAKEIDEWVLRGFTQALACIRDRRVREIR